jgi:hypothetical protein
MRPGLDCPADATWFDGLTVNENGAPKFNSNQACLFERDPESPAWRHTEDGETYGRPTRELVLRSAATIGNYDYIIDWRFDPVGGIEVAVGATGVIETKHTVQEKAADHEEHSGPEYGQFVGLHTFGVNHDHFFSFRLDFDIDGPNNSFMTHRMVLQRLANDPMRKSIWVAQPSMAATEKDAILDIQLDRPSMWMFMIREGSPQLSKRLRSDAWRYGQVDTIPGRSTAKSGRLLRTSILGHALQRKRTLRFRRVPGELERDRWPGRLDPSQPAHCEHRHRGMVHAWIPPHHACGGLAHHAYHVAFVLHPACSLLPGQPGPGSAEEPFTLVAPRGKIGSP